MQSEKGKDGVEKDGRKNDHDDQDMKVNDITEY